MALDEKHFDKLREDAAAKGESSVIAYILNNPDFVPRDESNHSSPYKKNPLTVTLTASPLFIGGSASLIAGVLTALGIPSGGQFESLLLVTTALTSAPLLRRIYKNQKEQSALIFDKSTQETLSPVSAIEQPKPKGFLFPPPSADTWTARVDQTKDSDKIHSR